MFGLSIILAHLAGDYLFQTHWMAENKTKANAPAAYHAIVYTICYLPLFLFFWPTYYRPNPLAPLEFWSVLGAALFIGVTHYFIDRYRLAKYIGWLKNSVAPAGAYRVSPKVNWGYPESTPVWMSTWLMIIADNTVHLILNTLALTIPLIWLT